MDVGKHQRKRGELINILEISYEDISRLNKCSFSKLHKIASNYIDLHGYESLINCSSAYFETLIPIVDQQLRDSDNCDEFLRRGASTIIMQSVFGMHSREVVARRRMLCLPTRKGRRLVMSDQDRDKVYVSWMRCLAMDQLDYSDRLLNVARETEVDLVNIVRYIEEINQIQNEMSEVKLARDNK